MAENMRTQRPTAAWGWMLGAVVVGLLLVIWFVTVSRDNPTQARESAPEEVGTSGTMNLSPIDRYLAFATEARTRLNARSSVAGDQTATAADASIPAMGEAHAFTAEGLRRLGNALATMPGGSMDSVAASLRSDADALEKDPRSLQHADIIRRAFERTAAAIAERDPALGARLRQAAASVDVTRPLLDQRNQVQEFFAEAGDAIRAMRSS